MASPLKRKPNDEPTPDLEELYLQLFPKMGRDFVYKEDLEELLTIILTLLAIPGVDGFIGDGRARQRALEYQLLLESGRQSDFIRNDLINLDDDHG